MKHTPGPWKVQKPDSSSYAHTIIGNGFWIADVAHGAIKGDDIANARLIAAAPELLNALDYLLEQTVDMDLKYGIGLTEGETEARTQALAAIAKATGGKP